MRLFMIFILMLLRRGNARKISCSVVTTHNRTVYIEVYAKYAFVYFIW